MIMSRCLVPSVILLLASLLTSLAQTAPVVVRDVKFNSNVNPYKWNNVVIKLRANSNPDPEALNQQYVDNVDIRFTIGYELDASERKFLAFQTEVKIATLEVAKDKSFAFYVPYDIVERNNLPKEPKYWVIELTVNGQEMPMAKENTSRTIKDRATLESFFSNVVSGQATQNEGIMVPEYLSPYGPIDRSPPAFIRKEPK